MAAKFTKGDSITTTHTTRQFNGPPRMKTKNSMNGMPGYINAHQTESLDHARGGKGVGPHREAPIGEKGGSGAKSMAKESKGCGTVTKDYKSSSIRSAGTLKSNTETGAHHVHTKTRGRMPGQKEPPTSKGILGGTVRKAGIDNVRSKGFQAAIGHNAGHRGRMERLAGSAKTHAEGRRKSVMY